MPPSEAGACRLCNRPVAMCWELHPVWQTSRRMCSAESRSDMKKRAAQDFKAHDKLKSAEYPAAEPSGKGRLKRKEYEKALRKLHIKLVKVQEWVRREKQKVCILFEGRDGAGKAGTIKAITSRVST